MLRFFNTLSRQVEDFQPLEDNHVRMYICGPTVGILRISGILGRLFLAIFCGDI